MAKPWPTLMISNGMKPKRRATSRSIICRFALPLNYLHRINGLKSSPRTAERTPRALWPLALYGAGCYHAFILGEGKSVASYPFGQPIGASVVPTKKQLKEAAEAADRVDWAKIDAMTDSEIEAAARGDPDNPLLTKEQLARMRLVVRNPRKKSRAAE